MKPTYLVTFENLADLMQSSHEKYKRIPEPVMRLFTDVYSASLVESRIELMSIFCERAPDVITYLEQIKPHTSDQDPTEPGEDDGGDPGGSGGPADMAGSPALTVPGPDVECKPVMASRGEYDRAYQ